MTDTASTVETTTDAPATPQHDPDAFFNRFFAVEEGEPAKKKDPPAAPAADEDETDEETADAVDEADEESPDDEEDAPEEEDTEDDESTEDDEEQPQTFTVKIDGKDEQVPLDELLKGYSRTKVFTQKTQEAAEIRRAAEAEKAAVVAEREALAKAIEAVNARLVEADPEPDWDTLRETDRDEYLFQKAVWAEKREKREKLEAVKAEMERRNAETRQQQLVETLKREQAALLEAIPAWKDEKVAKKELADIRQHALALGFPEEMLDQVYDHRIVKLLRNSARYEKLTADKDKLPGKPGERKKIIEKGPGTLKPGSAKKSRPGVRERRRAAAEKVSKTGRADDAAAFFRASGIFDD